MTANSCYCKERERERESYISSEKKCGLVWHSEKQGNLIISMISALLSIYARDG